MKMTSARLNSGSFPLLWSVANGFQLSIDSMINDTITGDWEGVD